MLQITPASENEMNRDSLANKMQINERERERDQRKIYNIKK